MKNKKLVMFYSVLASLLLMAMVGCGFLGLTSPAPTVTPTITPAPPTSTLTPRPTATMTPTVTPILPKGEIPELGRVMLDKQIHEISFSPDGDLLAVAAMDGVYLYDVATMDMINYMEDLSVAKCVAFSPDGTSLAAGTLMENEVVYWDAETAERLFSFLNLPHNVYSVAFSSDRVLASGMGDGNLFIWWLDDDLEISWWEPMEDFAGDVRSLAFSQDGEMLAAGDEAGVVLMDTGFDFHKQRLEGHRRDVFSVAFSPDGAVLASGSQGGALILWDIQSGEQLRTIRTNSGIVYSLEFSPDGTILASGTSDATILWDAETGERLRTLEGVSDIESVKSVSFSPDGEILASGYNDGGIVLWDLKR